MRPSLATAAHVYRRPGLASIAQIGYTDPMGSDYRRASVCIGVLAILAACGSGARAQIPILSPQPTCGPPSPQPTPIAAWLDYPPNGSTGVSTTIGEIIETGAEQPGNSALTIVLSSGGVSVPIGTPTVAPTPYPTPYSTPGAGVSGPAMAIPLPALSPNTAYTVSDVYTGWADNPPACTAPQTQFVGSFTTGS